MLTIINLTTTDPAFNLAAEQYVFENLPKDRNYFMLWQNDNAVIIGKYQNTTPLRKSTSRMWKHTRSRS